MDTSTKNLLQYCKKNGQKRGLDYISQIESDIIENVNVRQVMYVHTQFKTIHMREIICTLQGDIIDSHYY